MIETRAIWSKALCQQHSLYTPSELNRRLKILLSFSRNCKYSSSYLHVSSFFIQWRAVLLYHMATKPLPVSLSQDKRWESLFPLGKAWNQRFTTRNYQGTVQLFGAGSHAFPIPALHVPWFACIMGIVVTNQPQYTVLFALDCGQGELFLLRAIM